MPQNPELFQPMTNLKAFEQMTDIYGVAIDVHPVRTFRDGKQLGAGYDLLQPSSWFVYDRDSTAAKWHKHYGPYSALEQAADWIRGIREVEEPTLHPRIDGSPMPLSAAMLEAIKTWAADDRLWGSRSTTEFNLCTFARVILKAQAEGK